MYAVGSLADGSFGLVIQDIGGLHSTPGEVNTGGLLETGGGNLMPILVLALGAAALLASVPVLARRRSR